MGRFGIAVFTCDSCQSTDLELAYNRGEISVITGSGDFKMDVKLYICKTCGLIQQNRKYMEKNLEFFYSNQYKVMASAGMGASAREEQAIYLKNFLTSKHSSMLDIGSYEGYFLNLFKNEGWYVEGVEPSSEAAKNSSENYGIFTYNQMFENIDFGAKKYDVITIRHVLEHVASPDLTIKKIASLLNDTGVLYIEVPDILNIEPNNIADFFDFQHLYNFSKTTLKNYLSKNGFSLLDISQSQSYCGLRAIAIKGENSFSGNDYIESKAIISSYINSHSEFISGIRTLLYNKNAEWSEKSVYLYGGGFHTLQMFENVINRNDFNIKGIIDSNIEKRGKKLLEYPIFHKDDIKELKPDAIIISSYAFQDFIYNDLKYLEAEGVDIVRLYENVRSYDTF